MNEVPTDEEYRKLFHIGKLSFIIILIYLQAEDFFNINRNANKVGRPRRIKDGVIFLAIISYFTQYQSLDQCSFRAGR